MFEESFGAEKNIVGSVLEGKVVALEGDCAVIDVGLKTEGRVPLKEFLSVKGQEAPKPGDVVEVFIERLEDRFGKIQISREKVQREEAWQRLEEQFQNEAHVKGTIKDAVKGGFTVDLDGAEAFLPGSLVDIRPLRDHADLLQKEQEFQILKMDRARNNIVVSRRAILEKERAGQREKLIETIQEGRVMEGIVKNITDYGAFIDLGGIDGLLHVTDMSWKRINHPRDVVEVGASLTVQIIRYNAETQRVSLGIKQMEKNPWDEVGEKFPVDAKVKGRVTRVTDYGAFVELEPGIEGLVHVSEMSWMRKNVHPSKMVSVSEEVEVQGIRKRNKPDKPRHVEGLVPRPARAKVPSCLWWKPSVHGERRLLEGGRRRHLHRRILCRLQGCLQTRRIALIAHAHRLKHGVQQTIVAFFRVAVKHFSRATFGTRRQGGGQKNLARRIVEIPPFPCRVRPSRRSPLRWRRYRRAVVRATRPNSAAARRAAQDERRARRPCPRPIDDLRQASQGRRASREDACVPPARSLRCL